MHVCMCACAYMCVYTCIIRQLMGVAVDTLVHNFYYASQHEHLFNDIHFFQNITR